MSRLIPALLVLSWALLSWQAVLAADAALVELDEEETAVELSIRLTQQITLYNQQLDSLETEFGPFNRALLEPLQGLTALFIETENFEEVERVLSRRLQLLHIAEGPESVAQLPLIAEFIVNNIRRRQWQEVLGNFENIRFIQSQNPNADTITLLNAMNATLDWHSAAIYVDKPGNRVRHFQESREIQRQILRLAEDNFDEESPELIPWLYQDAIEQYRIATFLSSKDELGADARERIGRAEARPIESYLREGLSIIKRIRRIVETMDDAEAEAMAMIYEADFQMLLELGTAARLYRNAMDRLEESGIDPQRVAAFFARPVVLPTAKFHFSLDEAFAAQAAYGYSVQLGAEGEDDTVHMGDYVAWNESIPNARLPLVPDLASSLSIDFYQVDMRFTVYSRGYTRTPRTPQSDPDTVRVRRDAQDALKAMYFRPKFLNKRWRTTPNLTMRYLYPAPQ